MKKYYMSFIDFSEVINITADPVQLTKATERMTDLGLLTEKGNPSVAQLNTLAVQTTGVFLDKLQKRVARRDGGICVVRDTFRKLFDKKEYHAMFFFLAFMYGFIQWQVPEKIALLPATPETLKIFMGEFISDFDKYMETESEAATENAETEESI